MMKRFILTAVLTATAATALLAQRGFGPRDAAGTTPPDPATMVAHQVARLTALLDLTTAQANQATSIFTAAATASTPLQTALGAYHTSLQTAVKSNSTGTIDQVAGQIGVAQGQLVDIQSKAQAAFYATLTSTQQTKLDTLGPGIGGPGGPGGPGGHGPGGPQ